MILSRFAPRWIKENKWRKTMAVYVDNLRDYGWRHGPSCHLIADSVEELMEFAVEMGLRPEWFQAKSTPHFDLTIEGRTLAVEHGAIEIDQRQLVAKIRELRKLRLQNPPDEKSDSVKSRGA